MINIDVYRILEPNKRRWWKRTWQAEWDGCQWAPRAFTEAGCYRKALRWSGWSARRTDLYIRRRRYFRGPQRPWQRLAVHKEET